MASESIAHLAFALMGFDSEPIRTQGIIVDHTMLSKYGKCTHVLKIKNKLKIGCFNLQIKSGRILNVLWAFLIKQLFHWFLLDVPRL